MSTSVERIMRERGDVDCLHEPFMYHYYLNQKNREMPHFEPQADHPVSYQEVRNMIFNKAQRAPVFFKDMAYYIDTDILSDDEFCRSVTHCFLIRRPQAAIASYYKLDKEVTLPEIGIEAQWRVYQHLVDSGMQAVVIQTEDIRKEPQACIGAWWQSIGLKNTDSAFEWSKDTPDDWKQVEAWHQKSISSTSIRPWTADDEARELRQFEAVANEAPHLRFYLQHHLDFYHRLKSAT